MDDSERDALVWMIEIAVFYETTSLALLDMAWVADGVSDSEERFISWMVFIPRLSAAVSESIVTLAWIADGVSDTEANFVSWLYFITEQSATVAETVIALTWVADGVSDTEADFIGMLHSIAKSSIAVAERVIALTWVADGVSDTEAGFAGSLERISKSSAAAAERVLALTWVADGVSDSDLDAILYLSWVSAINADAAARVADMPFIQTLESSDGAALESLGYIAAFEDEGRLARIMASPMLEDGITDDEAPVVSTLFGTVLWSPNPAVIDTLLDPDVTTVEWRTIELPLAGEVDLAIVRTRPGARRSMDMLESAVREAESLMGEPLPTRYVGLLYENAAAGLFAGTNFGTHMTIRPRYVADTHLIAHEVAHYYWRANAAWIDEGMAEFMASAIENRRVGTPIDVTNAPCRFARSIKELETLAPKQGDPAFGCNYSLGEQLFISLFYTLGEDAFWDGALSLYAASPGAGIEEVRQAFGADDGDAGDVIERWYERR